MGSEICEAKQNNFTVLWQILHVLIKTNRASQMCTIRIGWITTVFFSLGSWEKHKQFLRKTSVTVLLCNTIIPLTKMYFYIHISPWFWATINCIYIDVLWVICKNYPMLVLWEGRWIPWECVLGVMWWRRQSTLECPSTQAVGRKGGQQNWWHRHCWGALPTHTQKEVILGWLQGDKDMPAKTPGKDET